MDIKIFNGNPKVIDSLVQSLFVLNVFSFMFILCLQTLLQGWLYISSLRLNSLKNCRRFKFFFQTFLFLVWMSFLLLYLHQRRGEVLLPTLMVSPPSTPPPSCSRHLVLTTVGVQFVFHSLKMVKVMVDIFSYCWKGVTVNVLSSLPLIPL